MFLWFILVFVVLNESPSKCNGLWAVLAFYSVPQCALRKPAVRIRSSGDSCHTLSNILCFGTHLFQSHILFKMDSMDIETQSIYRVLRPNSHTIRPKEYSKIELVCPKSYYV